MSKTNDEIDSLVSLARVGFEEDLYRLMQAEPVTRSELARRIGSSSAYISKVLNGATNYTLQTIAKLAKAVGAIVQIRLVREGMEVVRVVSIEEARQIDARNHAEAYDQEDAMASVAYYDFRGGGKPLRGGNVYADAGVALG